MFYTSMTDQEQRERDGDVSPDHTLCVWLLAVGCTTGQKCPEHSKVKKTQTEAGSLQIQILQHTSSED